MRGPPGSPPAVCRGGVRHGSACTLSGSLGPSQVRQCLGMPPVHTTLSGMSLCQLFSGHRVWVAPRDIQRGQAGIAWPDVQLWLQGCAGLSRTKQPGQDRCRLGSQQHPRAWDDAIQCPQWTISFAGAAGKVQPARGVSVRFSDTVTTLHQVFILVLGTQNWCPEPL